MANEEQLAILKQGVDVWNQWRRENPGIKIYFDQVDLRGANLSGANLSNVNLYRANLHEADLFEANLRGADLRGTKLRRAMLSGANLDFSDLVLADLREAILREANLRSAILNGANLIKASLNGALLSGAHLRDADFTEGRFGTTYLGNVDLRSTVGLETVNHNSPSTIGTDTLEKSQGQIPEAFLRGCGLSDVDIEYAKLANPNLTAQDVSEITHKIFELKDTRPIQISPLFISYSHTNSNFVDRIETKLNEKGIRFWRDIHDATAGRLERQIDRAIRHNPTVLLILSENSTSSDWVEHEARLARQLEKELGRDVLCPIALDDSWKTCNWPERIKEQIMEYNILDFSNWEDETSLDKMFKKLIDGLDMFYKK